jgi:hypothetical protein
MITASWHLPITAALEYRKYEVSEPRSQETLNMLQSGRKSHSSFQEASPLNEKKDYVS